MEKVWTEKYRPKIVADLILPEGIRQSLVELVAAPAPPCLIFTGKAGIGKTSAALALTEEKDAQTYFVNSSLNRSIDTLRNELQGFASSIAFNGNRKYIILDEADNLPETTQKAMRSFMEEFSTNCGFILTANYPNKLIPAIRDSRCIEISFEIPKKEKITLLQDMIARVDNILALEKIKYDQDDVPELVMAKFPDFRAILNRIQFLSMSGELVLDKKSLKEDFKALVRVLKSRDYGEAHKWYLNNSDADFGGIVRSLYDNMKDCVEPDYIPALVMLLDKALYEQSFVADTEIHMMATFVNIMSDITFQ